MDIKIDEDAIPYNKSFEEFELEHLNKPGTLVWVRSHIDYFSSKSSSKITTILIGNVTPEGTGCFDCEMRDTLFRIEEVLAYKVICNPEGF